MTEYNKDMSHSWYKGVRNILFSLVALFVFFTVFIPVTFIPYNRYALTNFAQGIFSIVPPQDSIVIENKKEFGSLVGNGDHCDFYASVVLQSDLSENELLEYYQRGYKGESEIGILKLSDNNEVDSDSVLLPVRSQMNDVKHKVSGSNNENKFFILYIYEPDYVSGIGDLRCG